MTKKYLLLILGLCVFIVIPISAETACPLLWQTMIDNQASVGQCLAWVDAHDAVSATALTGGGFCGFGRSNYCGGTSVTHLGRNIMVFNVTGRIPDGEEIKSCHIRWSKSQYNNIDPNGGYGAFVSVSPESFLSATLSDYSDFGIVSSDGTYFTEADGYRNTTIDPSLLIYSGDGTRVAIGFMLSYDILNSPYSGGSYDKLMVVNSPVLYIDSTGIKHGALLSASGKFCYGNEIQFNLTETGENALGIYTIHAYQGEFGTPDHQKTLWFENGPLLWNVTLEPGDWACTGWITVDTDYQSNWLNFTIEQSCENAWQGTINESYNPWTLGNFSWNWNYVLPDPPPYTWEEPTFDNGNGTSYIDLLLSSGIINQTEYDDILAQIQFQIDNQQNITMFGEEYGFGLLTPLYMIDDAINTTRANLNSSVSVVQDGLSPISTIFVWIFQIIPSWVINLMTVGLALDASRLILNARKN